MNSVLLLAIGVISPWTVHLAPPKQRPLALVGVLIVYLLFGIFAGNPLFGWQMWAGLAVGIASVLFFGATGRHGPRRPVRRSTGPDDGRRTGDLG